MAFFDWNNNGKKDIQDDFIEYQIYTESNKNTNNYSNNHNSTSGMSNFGAAIATIASIFISAAILAPFNLEGIALVIAFIIIVSIVGAVIAMFFG